MPTGYTAKLMESGEDFPAFALRCAKAFGACVTLREDDIDEPIPEKFEPSDYSVKKLAEAERELKRLSRMTTTQRCAFGQSAKKKTVANHEKWAREHREADDRIDEMVRKVNAWSPPSPDHAGMKTFMLEQLKISRNGSDYWEELTAKSMAKPALDYFTDALSAAANKIKYHREEIERERARVDARNQWLQQLRASLNFCGK